MSERNRNKSFSNQNSLSRQRKDIIAIHTQQDTNNGVDNQIMIKNKSSVFANKKMSNDFH
jgi:hypothetical protein